MQRLHTLLDKDREKDMKVKVVTQDAEKLKQAVTQACYSGERFIIRGEDGLAAAIVPVEDLEVLGQIEMRKINN